MKITSIHSENILYGYLFFLSVNLVGAILGYLIKKELRNGSLKLKMFVFFTKSFSLSFIFCYLLYGIAYLLPLPISEQMVWNILAFGIFYFWIPALIATTIVGMYKWFKSRK